ncbi:hypothetical protein L195_g064095, partial [Trifolium pratense]
MISTKCRPSKNLSKQWSEQHIQQGNQPRINQNSIQVWELKNLSKDDVAWIQQ